MPSNKEMISVVIPVFNEAETIDAVVAGVNQLPMGVEVIVVDDGSEDDGLQTIRHKTDVVCRHPYCIGNGAAVKTGIRTAGGDVLVVMDGDGQHDPSDIPLLLAPLDRYDMVVGARSADQQASWFRWWMNRIFNRLASYVTGVNVADLTSGFRAMRLETARDLLPLLPNGYSWPTTSTLVLLRSGMSVSYQPINGRSRQGGRSRIRPVRDGVRFFMIILKICTLYAPFRIFLPVSGTMFLLGAANYAYTYVTSGRFTNMSALMFSAAVIIFMMGLISEQISQISLLRRQMQPGNGRPNRDAARGSDHVD